MCGIRGYTPAGKRLFNEKTPQPARPTPPSSDERTPSSCVEFKFNAAQKLALNQCGISETQIARIELLQTIFFRSPHGDQLNPRSYLSKAEFDAICAKLDSQEISELVFTLKSLYEDKIPESSRGSDTFDTTVYTPALRLSCQHRQTCIDSGEFSAKEISGVLKTSCTNIKVEHVTGLTFVEEETPETPEERAARHKLKEDLFKVLEANRGLSDESRSAELNSTEQIWADYFEFMRRRVKAIIDEKSFKIRADEIESAFKKFVSSAYTSIKIQDSTVYFNANEIDLNRRNTDNKTNKQLLSEGLSPIGADGKPMNLHHLTRRQPGIFVLLTETFHQKNSALLHLRGEKHMHQPKAVDRRDFEPLRSGALAAIKKVIIPDPKEFNPAVRLSF